MFFLQNFIIICLITIIEILPKTYFFIKTGINYTEKGV